MSNGTPAAPQTLAEVWREFTHRILDPINAERIQRQETRRAFYAGASAAVTILTGNLSQGGEPTEADFALLDNLVKELDSFGEAVRQGRA